MKTSGNTILITGGTSGIGRALAEQFHQRGNQVIVAGRRQALLDEVTAANPGMAGYTLDMEDAAAIRRFAGEVLAAHPSLNVLINNAGIMVQEDLTADQGDLGVPEAIVTTNLLGPIRLTAALLPHLMAHTPSTIVNVSSGLAFVPLTVTPTYSATKAVIHSYTISLREQLHGKGVEVLELAPPGVQTDLMPGQAANPQMMPLEEFIHEIMGLFEQEPTPSELCVQRVMFLRRAEAEGRFEQTLATLNQHH